MRRTALAFALTLAACGPPSAPPPPSDSVAPARSAAATTPWFICDGIDAPALLVLRRDGAAISIAQYGKPNGELIGRTQYQAGGEDAGMGSVYTALSLNGAEAGSVRRTNPGMLETPASAYTPRFTEVRLGERAISCRWLPRTRVFGFTGRRSFVIHEDRDGDLIYTTYDFAAASRAQPAQLSENGESTTFSAEVRGGEEMTRADSADFTFAGRDGYSYHVGLTAGGAGVLEVLRNGDVVQSEPLIAYQQGTGPE